MAERTNPHANLIIGAQDEATPVFEKIKASSQSMAAGVEQAATKAAGAVGGIGDKAAPAAQKLDGITSSMIRQVQRLNAELEAGGARNAAYFEKMASVKGADLSALAPYLADLKKAEAAQRVATTGLDNMGLSAKQTAAALRQVPMQFTDIVVSLQGGQSAMQVFLQQGGQLKDMFGGAGNAVRAMGGYVAGLVTPFTMAAAAIATIAVAYKQGSAEADGYRMALVMTGNAAGTTASQMQQMAGRISSVVGTQGAAAEALAQMAASGRVASDSLEYFSQVAIKFERSTGTAISETVQRFAELGASPVEASRKLNEQTNYLTASIYEQIKSLKEQGREYEAAALAQNTYADALNNRSAQITQNLGAIEGAWKAIKDAAKSGWDAMLNVGRADSLGTQIDNMRAKIAQAKGQDKNRPFSMPWDTSLADLEKQLSYLTEQERVIRRGAEAQAQRTQAEKEAIAATDALQKTQASGLTNQQKMNKALEEYSRHIEKLKATNPASALLSPDAIARGEKAIRDQFADKGKGSAGINAANKELADQAKLIAELNGLTGSFAKDWDTLSAVYKKGEMSLEQLTQAQGELLAKQPAIKAAADAEQKALEETAKARQMAAAARTQEADGIAAWFAQQEAAAAQSLQSVTDRVAALQAEEAAVTLATSLNISLAEAIERVAIERLREKQTGFAEGSEGWQDIEREIDARKKLLVMVSGKTQREDEARGWADMWQSVDRTAHDVFVNVLEGGQDAFERLGKTLKATVLDVLYQMTVRKWIINIGTGIFGAGFGAAANAATGGGAGGALSAIGSIGSGYSLLSGIGGTFGGGLSAGFGGLMGSLGLSATGSTLGGAMSAGGIALQSGNIMGGLGTIAGALGPIALGIGLLTSFIKKPTPHSGAGVTYSASGGLTSGASQYSKTNYGFGAAGEYSAESNTAVASVAKGIATALDSTAVAFGKKAGFEISTAFADDKSKDGAWGQLAIKLGGQTVLDWRDTQTSKWAPKEFADGEAGLKEYQAAVAASMRDALSSLDLPGWVDSVLQDLGDAPALEDMEKALSSIALANDAMAALGSQIGGLSGLSDEATASLIEAFGGVESFAATASEYANVVLTDAEKVSLSMTDISSQFEALGMAVPSSVSALQDLIGAQDLTTDAGREAVASLMTLGTSFATVMDQMQQSIGLTGDSLKSVFQNVLKQAHSAEEARVMGEQAAGQLLMDAISNALVGTVTDLVSNAVLQPITQSIVGAAAQAATMDVAAASTAGATLAAGGAAGGMNVAAGGAAGGANVAAGGAAAGAGLAEIVGRAVSVTNSMVEIMTSADFQAAFGAAVSAIGDISATLFGGMTSIQTSMPGFAGGGSAAVSGGGGGGGGSSATDNKNPLDDLLEERRQLEIQLLQAQGQEQEALNRIRAKAIEGMSAEAVAAWDFNRAIEKQIEQAQQVADLKQEHHNLEIELLRAQGSEEEAVAAVRADAIKGMTAEAVALYDANAALQEQIEQAGKLRDLEKEGANLQIELLKAQGRDEEALALIREEAIKGLSAQAVAQYDANQAVQEQIDILNERKGLERRLLEAQGDTAAIRQLELAATHEANRAILLRIWALEDEKKAAEAAQTAVDAAFDALKRAVQSAQEAAEKALKDAYEATEKTLKEQISAAEKIRSAASESLSSLEGIFDLLKEQIKDLRNEAGAAAPVSEGNAYLDRLIASGAKPKQDELADAIESVRAGQKAERYGTAFEYNRDNLVLAGRLDVLQSKVGLQKTVAEQQLKAAEDSLVTLNEQLETAKTQYEEQLAKTKEYYEKVLENAQTQIDVLRGVDKSVLSVTAAVTALNAAVAAAAAQVASAVHSIGVDPGPSAGGASSSSTGIISDVLPKPNLTYDDRTQSSWGKVVPVNFRAGGGYTPAGLTVVGEEGPELVNFAQPSMVYTSAQTSNLLGRGDGVIAELRSLREDNRAQAQALVRMQARLVALMERWDGDGMPEERATA